MGHLMVTVDYFRVTICYLRAPVGWIPKVTSLYLQPPFNLSSAVMRLMVGIWSK